MRGAGSLCSRKHTGEGHLGGQESRLEEVNLWEGYAGVPQAGTWNHILDHGNPTWVWVTGVLSENTTENSVLICAETTGVPTSHKHSLIHFPQWAGLRLSFPMSVMPGQSLLLKNSRNAASASVL